MHFLGSLYNQIGRVNEAIPVLQQAADQGSLEAIVELAEHYALGKGVPASLKYAYKLCMKAKEKVDHGEIIAPKTLDILSRTKLKITPILVRQVRAQLPKIHPAPPPVSSPAPASMPEAENFVGGAPAFAEPASIPNLFDGGDPVEAVFAPKLTFAPPASTPPEKTWDVTLAPGYSYCLQKTGDKSFPNEDIRSSAYELVMQHGDIRQCCAIHPMLSKPMFFEKPNRDILADDLLKKFTDKIIRRKTAKARGNEGLKFLRRHEIYDPRSNIKRSTTLWELKILSRGPAHRILGFLTSDNLIEFIIYFTHQDRDEKEKLERAITKLEPFMQAHFFGAAANRAGETKD
jgi:hypothetical protein